jgi:hypothetical protein
MARWVYGVLRGAVSVVVMLAIRDQVVRCSLEV